MRPRDQQRTPQASPFKLLTSRELADRYVEVLRRVAPAGKRRSRSASSLGWLQDPELRAVLDEFMRRIIAADADRDAYLARLDAA